MQKIFKHRTKKAGAAPGTLVHIGEVKTGHTHITLTDYDAQQLQERTVADMAQLFDSLQHPGCTWINIDGLHDVAPIERLGQHFDIHPLTLEDIVHTGQRPKVEEYDNYFYVVVKMLRCEDETGEITAEQISLVLGDSFLISFQESAGDVFQPVRERLRRARGRIRKGGSDYLAYALLDAVVDHYFLILEKTGERIEDLENELLQDPSPRTLEAIHQIKREMIFLRRQIWPLRELLNTLAKTESELVQESTVLFLRDVYDHSIQVLDTVESYRDVLSGLIDLYLSTVSHRMNEVMKVLTIIATIFIPITFVAGIYGMNFKYMPELEWPGGYPLVWLVMACIAGVMLLFFKRKRWW